METRHRQMTLRSQEHLRSNNRFRAVQKQGTWGRGDLVSIGALPNNLHINRIGIRSQRGIKGGVKRNKARRLCREIYRTHKSDFLSGFDIVVVIKREDPDFGQLIRDFLKLSKNIGLLPSSNS